MRFALAFLILCSFACLQNENEPATEVLNEPLSNNETKSEPIPLNTQTKIVTVFYRHPLIEGLVPIERPIFDHPSAEEQIKQLINQLSIAPENGEGIPIWPENTHFRELYLISDGTIIVDFDGRFVDGISAGASTESFLLYSLVGTLLSNFPRYQSVRILVDGEIRETFLGHLDIEFPLKKENHLYTIVPEERIEDQIIIEELGPVSTKADQGLN